MIAIAMEVIVFLLHDEEVQVSSGHARLLIRNALERYSLPGVHALVQIDGQVDLLLLRFSIGTIPAVRSPHFSMRHASLVALLDLLDEARGDLLHSHLHAGTLALLVVLHAFLPVGTECLSHVRNFDFISKVKLLQCDTQRHVDVWRGLLALSSLASEATPESEVAEYIIEPAVASALSLALFVLLEPLLPMPVVYVLLLLVSQNFVGIVDLGELFRGTLFLVLVGVILQTLLSVCLLDLLWRGVLADTQQLVEVLCAVCHRKCQQRDQEL
mmetsp:Transcript_11858/g.27159  ORF Transcript_11858/g.27159 Transcript_11858/m.27159 type:complete len:271 (+) Transcript_11858:343-1155(+)